MLRTPTNFEKTRPRHSSVSEVASNHKDRINRLSSKLGELRVKPKFEPYLG